MSETRPASALLPSMKAGRSGRETIYYCPFCVEIRGKPDTEGKLYYNEQKGVGYCQKCHVRVFNSSVGTLDNEAVKFLERSQGGSARSRSVIDLSWTLPVQEVPEVAEYLRKRGISHSQIRRFRIRACRDPILGVVLPAKDLGNGRTDFIQIRDIRSKSWIKYRGVSDTVKPVYGIDFVVPESTGVLAEGVFSAISAVRLDPKFVPLCTYGKSIATHQLDDFRQVSDNLQEVIVMYDGGFFWDGLKAARELSLIIPNVKLSIAFLPDGKDPNDVDDCELEETIDARVSYNSIAHRALISEYVRSKTYAEFHKRHLEEYYANEAGHHDRS